MTLASRLPVFPWDELAPAKTKAQAHPGGIVDLSIGTPVDPVPPVVRAALSAAADSPGYPQVHGTAALREAAAGWLARRHGVTVSPDAVLPVLGTKELVASLPALLGCGPGDRVVYPELAYPTYRIGALLAAAEPVAADSTVAAGPAPVRLAWVNSPSNPTGRVLPAGHLAKMAAWARERGAVLASDECYIGLGWEADAGLGPAPRRLRRLARRAAGGALAVQAVQPGRLPGGLRHRRPGADRRPAGDPQALRDDAARASPGGDDRRTQRRRACRANSGSGTRPGAPGCGPRWKRQAGR